MGMSAWGTQAGYTRYLDAEFGSLPGAGGFVSAAVLPEVYTRGTRAWVSSCI